MCCQLGRNGFSWAKEVWFAHFLASTFSRLITSTHRRSKLGADPNNTAWSNSTSRYGHRVLISQGWSPGNTLGQPNSTYASHYTAASASHIRVVLKDDNLGLGAKRGKNANDETFGLTLLSGLLGRINGKSDDVLRKEEAAVRDVKLMRYQGEKWGSVGFVFGGYLVGDSIEETIEEADLAQKDQERRLKELKGSRNFPSEAAETSDQVPRPQKRSRKTHQLDTDSVVNTENEPQTEETNDSEDYDEEKRRRKEDKRARKEERRQRKEKKRLKRLAKQDKQAKAKSETDAVQSTSGRDTEGVVTPQSQSGSSTPLFTGGRGRHAIRQKYIQSKRMACLDDKALNEVSLL